jgi:ubiquinone/menaquinone biosynthesis C-methylase UbiE
MPIWMIAAITIIITLSIASLYRVKIPRDPGKEGKDNPDSTLAYDHVSRSLLFWFFRFIVIRQLKKCRPQDLIADIGCGPGYLASAISGSFPGLRVIGIDYSSEMVHLAKRNSSRWNQNSGVFFQKADVISLPFESNSLDFAVSTLSLHHWPAANQALHELHRVLQPGGQILIFDLRRDETLLAYYTGHLLQRLFSPAPINRVNGAIGSIWSSYTPSEMCSLISTSPFQKWDVKKGWAWAYIWAQK